MTIKKQNNMRRLNLFLCTLIALFVFGLNSCNNQPTPPSPVKPDPVGTTYPRVLLFEHFTGEGCGYCPYGMDLIYDFYSQNPDNYVWISNHTYGKDEFTVSESNTIAKKLKVSGAPFISINRTSYGGARCYHPYYTSDYAKREATTASAMVELSRKYDSATRELIITVSGKSGEEVEAFKLTVAITESGMVGRQSDYLGSWAGWRKFTHTHAVRKYVTGALGDQVEVKNRVFSLQDTVTLGEKWVADNCEIVAWITPTDADWPVINAAKLPVVEGSKGGEDIRHGGIEEIPVPDTYPEEGAPNAETVFTDCEATYAVADGRTVMYLALVNPDSAVAVVSNTNMLAYSELYLLLPSGSTTIPVGTYTLKDWSEATVGDAIAGFRNDETHTLDGCTFLWVYKSGSDLYLASQWMLASGSIEVTESGLEITGTTKNGSPVHATYTGAITPRKQSAQEKINCKIGRQD